jgi:hypothetical protein
MIFEVILGFGHRGNIAAIRQGNLRSRMRVTARAPRRNLSQSGLNAIVGRLLCAHPVGAELAEPIQSFVIARNLESTEEK